MVKAAGIGIGAVIAVLLVVIGTAMPTPDERADDKRVAQCQAWYHDEPQQLEDCINE